MSIPDAVVSLVTGLVGAIVGGLLTIRASMKAVEKTAADLETMEIRKQKVECIVAVNGLKFVMAQGVSASLEYRMRFLSEMNKIAVLWCDDQKVLNNMRDVLNGKTDENLLRLLRSLGKSTTLPMQNLADMDLTRVFLIPLTDAPPIITPPQPRQ